MFNTAGVSVGLPGFASSGSWVAVADDSGSVGAVVGVRAGVLVSVGVAVSAGLGVDVAVDSAVGVYEAVGVAGSGVFDAPLVAVISVTRPAMGVGPRQALSRSSAQAASQANKK